MKMIVDAILAGEKRTGVLSNERGGTGALVAIFAGEGFVAPAKLSAIFPVGVVNAGDVATAQAAGFTMGFYTPAMAAEFADEADADGFLTLPETPDVLADLRAEIAAYATADPFAGARVPDPWTDLRAELAAHPL